MSAKIKLEVLVVLALITAIVAFAWWAVSSVSSVSTGWLSGLLTPPPPALGCRGTPLEFRDSEGAFKAFLETDSLECRTEAWHHLTTSTEPATPTFENWQEACSRAKGVTNSEFAEKVIPILADTMDKTARNFTERLQAMCCDPSAKRGMALRETISQQADDFDDWLGVMVAVRNATCPGNDDGYSPWNMFTKEFVNRAERGMAVNAQTSKHWLFLAILGDNDKSGEYAVMSLRTVGSFEDYYEVADMLSGNKDMRLVKVMSLAMVGMEGTAATFDEWRRYLNVSFGWLTKPEVGAVAERLADLAVSLSEWVIVHHYANPDSATQRRAKKAIFALAKTERDWLGIAVDSNLRHRAYEKLKAWGDQAALPAEATP